MVLVTKQKMEETITLIKNIINDSNCLRLNKGSLKGYLGELIVKKKLEDEGFMVQHKGNKSGVDLEFNLRDRVIKIDVKSSFSNNNNFGWALNPISKKKMTCTHFICISFNSQTLNTFKFYIINSLNISCFKESKIFNSVKNSFDLPRDKEYLHNIVKVVEIDDYLGKYF